jgi:hypothetical protein
MTRTIARLFDDQADAERAVGELEVYGIPHDNFSLIRNRTDADDSWFGMNESLEHGAMRDAVADADTHMSIPRASAAAARWSAPGWTTNRSSRWNPFSIATAA